MDTKWKVGQAVWLRSGDIREEATVTRVVEDYLKEAMRTRATENYVQVEPVGVDEWGRRRAIWFAPDGKRQLQCFGYGPDASDPRPVGPDSGGSGPWELVEDKSDPQR